MLRRLVSLAVLLTVCFTAVPGVAAAAPLAPSAALLPRPLDIFSLPCAPTHAQDVAIPIAFAPPLRPLPAAAAETPGAEIVVDLSGGIVWGTVTPNTPVTVTVRNRAGEVKDEMVVASTGTGHYAAHSTDPRCNPLAAGDEVTITTGTGHTASTTVASIRALIRVDNDTVFGTTAASRRVETVLYQAEATCQSETTVRETTANASGGFVTEYGGVRDITRRALADVRVYDANDNLTFITIAAPHIRLNRFNDVHATLTPTSPYTLTHTSAISTTDAAETVLQTVHGTTDAWGNLSAFLTHTPQPGDHIAVSDGTQSIAYTVVDFALTALDLNGNQVSGTTAPNRRLVATFSDGRRADCTNETACHVIQSDATGAFTTPTGINLFPGDTLLFSILDAEGNWQDVERHPTQIVFSRDGNGLSGFWETPGVRLHTRLLDAQGAVKETNSVLLGPENGVIGGIYFAATVPGDVVEVGDGEAVTVTLTVADMTAYAALATQSVRGIAPAGQPLRVQAIGGSCRVVDVPASGEYTQTFSGLVPGSEVWVEHFDANGSVNTTRSHVPQIGVGMDVPHAQGYVERPGVPVTVTLTAADGAPIATGHATSNASGAYFVPFDPSLMLAPGQHITVEGQGGVPTALTLPDFTIALDAAQNRVYGQTVAGADVAISLTQGVWFLATARTTSDGSGDYAVTFHRRRTSACEAVVVGACTRAMGTLTTPEGHSVTRSTAMPPDVQADASEGDDTHATARPYAGPQSHTFHAALDVDWVQFTVGAAQVGQVFTVATTDAGVAVDTLLTLYDGDGVTELAAAGEFGGERTAALRYRFAEAGTYYVKVAPAAAEYTRTCGATYTLAIHGASLYLPLAVRVQ